MMTKAKAQTLHGFTSIKQVSRTCHEVRSSTPLKFLFISDVHFDSVKCDRPRLFRHLERAEAEGFLVFIFGDLFDLMGGKYDPRSSYSDIRPEYKSITYLDDVIEDTYERLKKYTCIRFIGRGNHETNIEKRMHTSPLDRLAQMYPKERRPLVAGYSGWLKIVYQKENTRRQTVSMVHYHHGYGGNAKRSKGVLNVDLDQMQFPDADLIMRGHTHQKWHVPITVDRVQIKSMRMYQNTTHHLQLGSYKMLGDRFAGWATEKGFNTPRLGGWFAELNHNSNHDPVWRIFEAN
jgi:hypothetical protein